MTTKPETTQKIVYIEYCRSCDTHNWCTHHDQSKYHDTFLKISQTISQQFPELQIIGNMVPHHLIPFKIAQNKYIDSLTNKYVIYPQIGSFEVKFQGNTIFSKKDTNSWPNVNAILKKIGLTINPNYQSPTKPQHNGKSPKKDKENTPSPTEKRSQTNNNNNNQSFLKSIDEKTTCYKEQAKGFTLTDHFKLYRQKKTYEDKDWMTEKHQSEGSCKQISEIDGDHRGKKENSQEKRKIRDGGETRLKEMLRNRGLMVKEQGRKEMIIKLDSIQQENVNYQQANCATQRTHEKSHKKQRLKQLQDDFSSLQSKFINFQNKVNDIHTKNKQIEYKDQPSEQYLKTKQAIDSKKLSKIDQKQQLTHKGDKNQHIIEKTNKLDQYVYSSEQQKNQKLHRIYGEWKLLKNNAQKNKKILEHKKQGQRDRNLSGGSQTSQTHSSTANMIVFQPKGEKGIIADRSKQKNHKYSTVQREQPSSNRISQPKFRTQENFYQKKEALKIKNDNQNGEVHLPQPTKLLKKGGNSISSDTFKPGYHKQNSHKFRGIEIDRQNHPTKLADRQKPQKKLEDSQRILSFNAKQNIDQIKGRINNLQQRIKYHQEKRPQLDSLEPINNGGSEYNIQAIYRSVSKSRSHSSASNYSAKKKQLYKNNQLKRKGDKVRQNNNLRGSHRTITSSSTKKNTKNEGIHPRSSNFSEITQKNHLKGLKGKSFLIKQESQFPEGNQNYQQHEYQMEEQVSFQQPRTGKNKQNTRPQKITENLRIRKQNSSNNSKQEENFQENYQNATGPQQKTKLKNQKAARQYTLHDPVTFLKKKKKWRQSEPVSKTPNKSRVRHKKGQSEENSAIRIQDEQHDFIDQVRLSESKQTISKNNRQGSSLKKKTNKTDKQMKSNRKQQEVNQINTSERRNFGVIRKNIRTECRQFEDFEEEQDQIQNKKTISRNQAEQQNEQQEYPSYKNMTSQQQQFYQQSEFAKESIPATPFSRGNSSEISPSRSYLKNSNSDQSEIPSRNSGRIVDNSCSKKKLGYYKSGQICYNGEKPLHPSYVTPTEQLPQNAEMNSICRQNQSSKKSKRQKSIQSAKKSSQNQRVSGWKLKTEYEQQNDAILIGREQSDQVEYSELLNKRKNTLDAELQEQKDQNERIEKHINNSQKQQKEQNYPEDFEQIKENEKYKKEGNGEETNFQASSQIANNLDKRQIQKLSTENKEAVQSKELNNNTFENNDIKLGNKQLEKSQKQIENKQVLETKKLKTKKKVKMEKNNNNNKNQQQIQVKAKNPTQQIDIEQILAKQYSAFLVLKISEDLCRQQTKAKIINQQGTNIDLVSPKQAEPLKQICPISFLQFQIKNDNTTESSKGNKQTQQYQEEQQEQSQYQTQNEQNQQAPKVNTFQDIIIQRQNPLSIRNVQKQEVTRLLTQNDASLLGQILTEEEVLQRITHSREKNPKNSKQKSVQEIMAPVAQTHDNKQQKKQQSPDVAIISKTIDTNSQLSRPQSKKSAFATSNKLDSNQPKINRQQMHSNNVYCQPREMSQFKQIGVQKELTLQVSVQTDRIQQVINTNILMARTNTIHNDYRNDSPSKEPIKPNTAVSNKISEISAAQNNFFNESQKQNLSKKKPQIERAHILQRIYSDSLKDESLKFERLVGGDESEVVREQGGVRRLQQLYINGVFLATRNLNVEQIQSRFTKLLKAVQILNEKSEWLISRLFQDRQGVLRDNGFGVWLCRQSKWQCYLVDDNVKIDELNMPLNSRHKGGQMWFNVLEKAVVLALGGQENLLKAETGQLFTMMTGCNGITVRVKQQPGKNGKLLQLMCDSLRKNYIVHAQKNEKTKTEHTYYVHSVRRGSGEQETLIELSQDLRQSFWVKLSKFVQQFSKIQVLQLRINHNFAHIELGAGRPGQLSVVQLTFEEEGQGCVTLACLGQPGPLRAFLYREQRNKVLKLVGQAKEKSKSQLFFECSFLQGRYFVFAQAEERPARLSYLGEGQPILRITEEIHSEGLKNEMAQYLPVREDQTHQKMELESQGEWRSSGKAPRLRDNFVQSRLRQNFVEYVLGRSKRF